VASASEEIALSRSAAPTSISGDASVLTLGDHGYETALKGRNGFVCLVQRSWAAGFDDAEFWNPKLRAPGDLAGHWHPHLMFFFADTDVTDWGADLHGSPVFAAWGDLEHITTFFVLVPKWSDGTPAVMEMLTQ